MSDAQNISGKIRSVDHSKAGEFADKFGSSRLEIISAWRTLFEQASEREQRRALERVRRHHPMPYPRIGRGNRRRAVA